MRVTSVPTIVLAVVAALVPPAVIPAGATAAPPHPAVVEEAPTPEVAQLVGTDRVPHPRVDALASHRGLTFVGGHFNRLVDASGEHRRHNFAVLDSETGQVLDYRLSVDGRVAALATRGDHLYLGGAFSEVGGRTRHHLAKVVAATGELVRDFRPQLDAEVREVEVVGRRIFVAGAFSGALLSLNRHTGSPSRYLRVPVLGTLAPDAGRTAVNRFAVDPDRSRLVAVGNFTHVGGQERRRAFMLNLAPRRARLSTWYYPPLERRCRSRNQPKVASISDADFSPDGSWFALSATGGYVRRLEDVGSHVCDAVARFETDEPAPAAPTWINYTGGDTVWTVEATGPAVYAEGHFRWFDNPWGRNDEGVGAVDRRGLAALDPATGSLLEWNPVMPSRRGGRALLATRSGLWAGSDALTVGGQPRRGLAYFPLPVEEPPPAG